MKIHSSLLYLFLLLVAVPALGQKVDSLRLEVKTRYMNTNNQDGLANFDVGVSYAKFFYGYQVNDWLSLGGQVNGLLNYGTSGVSRRDPLTGSGPIYEGNLWNTRTMGGTTHFGLPQLYALAQFGKHKITIGRFLKNTPIINAEPWPLPNALEGLWYEFKKDDRWSFQLGSIIGLAPRQTGRFVEIGKSIGQAGMGVDVVGNSSQYRDNIDSKFIIIANVRYKASKQLTIDSWNYLTDNVHNTFLLEPQWRSEAKDWTVKAMLIYQQRVGDGGNVNPSLTYMSDGDFAKAFYYGLRVEKRVSQNLFQLNFSRIADEGRLLLPREWGLEPFYTFQRRTRFEGASDVTAIMWKWQREWENEKRKMRLFVSGGSTKMPNPLVVAKNKFSLPSYSHWDTSLKVDFKTGFLSKFNIEAVVAYRFLADDISSENFRINRADFFHLDVIAGWRL